MITSLSNDKVKAWMKLYLKKYRDRDFLILDEEICKKAFEQGYLKTLVYQGEKPFDFAQAYEVSAEVMAKLVKNSPLNYFGIGTKKNFPLDFENAKRILILDDLQDPLNIGKIMNSAKLFGFDLVLASLNTADAYHEKSVILSKGALFEVPIIYTALKPAVQKFKDAGFKIYATGLHFNNYELKDVKPELKMAFILGNEGSGVRKELMDESDGVIKIAMCNIDSLNVAMAGAIIMYEFNSES